MQQAQIGLTKNHRNEGLATGEVTMSCAIRMPASGNGLPTNGSAWDCLAKLVVSKNLPDIFATVRVCGGERDVRQTRISLGQTTE